MINIDTAKVAPSMIDLLNQLHKNSTPIIIENNGKAVATLIDYQEWQRLKELETQLMAWENDDEYITTEEVINDYNLKYGTSFSKENIRDES